MNSSSTSAFSRLFLRRLFACLSVCLLAIGSASAASPIKLFVTHGSATASSDRLDRVDVDGTNVTSLAQDVANFNQPENIQIDETYEGGRIFMADGFGGTQILKYNLDGTGRTLIHTVSHGGLPRGLALDRANQHIYFTTQSGTSSSDRITRINYDGTGEVTIASGAVSSNDLVTNPLGLAIDTVRGFLYVGDNFNTVASNFGVVRFNLNGTGRTQIVAANNPTFNGNVVIFSHMTVDESTGQLYFCADSATTSNDRIMRVNSDGTGLTSLYSDAVNFNQPVGIAIDKANGWLFVGDSALAAAPAPVWRFNLDGSGGRIQVGTGYSNTSTVNGLAVFSNTAPTISDVTNQAIAVGGSTGNLAVTVGDGASETPVGSLLLSGTSSNQTLVPNGNIVLGGSGANRTVNVTGAPGQSGTATITLTLFDGARTVKDTFDVTVAALSNNADLSALALTTATINEAFAAATTAYTSSVPNATSSVTVTATRAQANATLQVQVNGGGFSALTSGSPSGALALNVGANTIDVRVTAQDGTTIKTYTTTVTRAAAAPTIATNDLMVIAYNSSEDVPVDSIALLATADIPNGTTIFLTDRGWQTSTTSLRPTSLLENTVTWVTSGVTAGKIIRISTGTPNATTIGVSDVVASFIGTTYGTLSGSLDPDLTSGDQMLIYTTADNNKDSAPTFIHAFNADAPSLFNSLNDDGPLDGWSDSDTSNLNNTSKLPPGLTAVLTTGDGGSALGLATYVNSGTDEFDNYIYNGPTSQTTRALWIARITTFANWLGRDATTYDTQTAGALSPANSNFSIGSPPSNNADLATLTTTAGAIAPPFAAGTTAYTANVANGTSTTTVTATRAEANATLQVRVNGGGFSPLTSGVASGNLALNVGANPIDVRVTAQDGTTIKTYTITVTRAPVPPNLSINDVTLSEGNSGTTTFSFTVSLSAPAPVGGVTFDIGTANGSATQPSDYTQTSLTAQTISAGSSTLGFNVPVIGDTDVETIENFFVNVTNVTGAVVTDGQGLGTINNDDVATPPTIASISPARGSIAGGTTVVITGTGFTGATGVNFGSTPATGFTVNSPTQITATLPAGTGGIFDITVTTGAGTGTGSGLFYYFTTSGGTPAVAASKVDIFTPNGAGKVLPGAPIQYRTLIANTGAGDATTVDFADSIPANTTLVPGSVNVSPLAEDNVYSTIVNTQLAAGTPTVLSGPRINSVTKVTDNDREFLTDTFTISAFDATSAAGGSVVMVTSGVNMGSFTYVPAPGFVGADSFTYTLRDDGTDSTADNADDLTGVGIVVINVVEADTVASGTQKVWYIDGSYAGANGAEDGTSARPFNALSDVSGASGLDAAGDTLYLAAGSYTGGITLLADQSLIGANQALVLNSVTLAAAGTDPVITNAGGAGITLATGNTIRGLTVGDTTSDDISGTAVGNLTIANVNCSGQGGLLRISTSGALSVTLDSAVSTSSTNGVSLTGTTGTCTLTGGSISGATGDDFVVSGGTAVISYGGTITNSTGRSVNIGSKTGGSVTFSGAITDTAGSTGISLTSNTGSTINFSGGLSLTTTSNAAFTATGGGTVNVTGATNTLTTTTAAALNVANTTIGASGLTFQSITAGTASGTAGVGISLDTTGSSGGLTVTGTGSAGSGGTIQRKTGANLSRTGGIGIYLNNTANVSLTRMQLNDFDNFAIRGFGVSGFTLANCVINGVNGNSTANLGGTDELGEGSVYFGNAGVTNSDGLNGTVSITNSTIQGGSARNLSIADTASTSVMRATISGCTFGLTQNLPGGNQSLAVEARNSGTTSHVSVTNSTFTGSMSDAMNFTGQTGTTMHVTVGGAGVGNTITNSHPGNNIGSGSMVFASQGIMFFDARNNTMSGANGSAVTIFKANLGTQMEGTFDSNVIGTNGVANSGSATGNGIFLSAAGAGAIKLAITNNMIQRYSGNAGIYADNTDGSYTVDLTVTGNTVRQPGPGVFAGLAVTNGAPTSADTTNVFLRALNNNFADGDPNNVNDIIVGASGSAAGTHTFTLSGATAGDVASEAAIQAFLQTNNNLAGAAAATVVDAYVDAPVTFSAFKASLALPAAPGAPLPLLFAAQEDLQTFTGKKWAVKNQNSESPIFYPKSFTGPAELDLTSKTAPKPVLAEKALTNENLQKLVLEAKARWEATGLTSEQEAALEALRIEISDLNELHLGQATGDLIQISRTAAGNAWFVDETPSDDSEFAVRGQRSDSQSPISNFQSSIFNSVEGVDLLTTLMHEMGHRLGLPDTYALRDRSSIMYGYLTRGERRLPAPNQARGAVLSTDETQRYLGATINIGTLPAGKSVTIVGTVLVNDPANTQLISSQGTVSGGNFASVFTDDPAFAGAADPTTTPVERPDATVVSIATGTTPTNAASVSWTVTFSTAVSNVVAANFALANSGLTAPSITGVTAVGGQPATAWTVTASTGTGSGTLGLNMANDSGSLSHDITNQPFTGQVYTIDKIAPVFSSITRQTPSGQNTNADTLVFRATFSETVVGVDAADFSVSGTTATITGITGTGPYDLTLSGGNLASLDGTVGLALAGAQNIADTAGNALPGTAPATNQTFIVDNAAPTVAITSTTGNPAANAVIPVTVTFNESVTGFDLTDITVAGGTKTNFAGTGAIYTFDLTPTGPGVTVTADVAGSAAQDAAGNNNTAATQFTRTIVDAVSIAATTATAAEGGATGLYTFTRGASAGDLTVSFQLDASSTTTAATDFTLSSSGTLTFTPGTGAGTIVIPNGQLTATVTLTALTESPNPAEAAETARLNVVAGSGYVAGGSPNATVTITENSFLVTTTSDSGTGSLRQAAANADAIAGADTITFSDGTGGTTNFTDATLDTITLSGGQVSLGSDITINGPGADTLQVRNTRTLGATSRVFIVPTGTAKAVVINGLTMMGGNINTGGGCMFIDFGANVTLRIVGCTITGNATTSGAAGLFIPTGNSVTVLNSTISGNTASGAGGAGGIDNSGSLTLINSTISGNAITGSQPSNAGGVLSFGTTFMANCTVTNNNGVGGTGGVRQILGTFTVVNSIIAANQNNSTIPDITGSFTSNGGNIIGNAGTATGFTNGTNSDQVGTGASPVNPQLAALANNGGRTQTHALLAGSPALNAGLNAQIPADTFDINSNTNTTEAIPFDQRGTGFTRAIGTVDIGAFELQKSVSIGNLAAISEGNSGTTNFVFTITRTGDTTGDVNMTYTVSGAAVNGTDFVGGTLPTGTATITNGNATTTVTIPVSGDTSAELNEAFTVTLSAPDNGYVVAGAPATSTINNDDTLTATINQASGQADPARTSPINFTVVFSESVTGFNDGDVTLGGASAPTTAAVTEIAPNNGTTFNVAVSGMTGQGAVTASIGSNVALSAGGAGHAAATSTDNSVVFDSIAPTAGIVVADTSLIFGETSLVTITFSEAVTGFDNADLTIPNGALTPVSSGDGITWTATFTPSANTEAATNVIALAMTGVADAAGNAGTGTTNSNNFVIDTLRPTVTLSSPVADPAPTVPFTLTATFSQAVTGFTSNEIVTTNAIVGTFSAVSPTVYTLVLTPNGSGLPVTANVAANTAQDTAGNGNTAAASFSRATYLRPTISYAYGAPQVAISGAVSLTYTVINPNPAHALTGLAFTDALPPGLAIATPNGVVNNLGGTLTATAGTNTISLSGGTLAAGATATLTLNVTGTSLGVKGGMLTFLTSAETPLNSTPGFVPPLVSISGISSFTHERRFITGTVDAADPTQTGRITRGGAASVPGTNKVFPGMQTTSGARQYDSHTITNTTGAAQDVNVWFNTSAGNNGFLVAYLGSFDPANPATNYLADAGSSFPSAASFGFTIPVGGTVVLVVHAVNPGVGFDYALGINTPFPAGAISTIPATVAAQPTIEVIERSVSIGNLAAISEGNSGTTNFVFTITRTGATTGSVAMTYTVGGAAVNAADFGGTLPTGTATIADGSATTTVTIPVSGDVLAELDEAFTVTLSAPNNGYLVTGAPATSTITNDDTLSVTLNQAAAQADPTNATTINFTAVFSEAVTDFDDAADVTLTGTAGATTTVITGGPTTYNVAVSGMTGSGTVIASIPAASVISAGSAANAASTSTDKTVTYDNVAPALASAIAISDTALKIGDTATVTFTFTEAVTGFDSADLTVPNGSIPSVSSGDGITWTGTLTPAASIEDASNLITLNLTGVADIATNPGIGTTNSPNYAIDTLAPTVVLTSPAPNPTPNVPIAVTAQFSETVVGFVAGSVTVTNATVSSFVAVDGDTYTFNLNPTGSNLIVTADITTGATQDTAGNNNIAATQFARTINAAPEITVPLAPGASASLLRLTGITTGINSPIATVSDAETPAASLVVTAITVPLGINVTNIVNNAGAVTADVSADAGMIAGIYTVVLNVFDGAINTTANLTIEVNNAPTVVAPGIADVRITIGDVLAIPLGAHFADVDLHTLTFTVSGNTVPAKASASITGGSNVTLTGLTYGTTDITIQADDGHSGLVTDTFQVAVGTVEPTPTMPATPPAGWRVNSQTALFDIDVPVQNTTAFDINGFRLTVDLSAYAISHPTLRLINYSSPAGVLPAYVDYPFPVAIGETVNVRLSFFVATRVMPNPFNPTLTVTRLTTSAVAGPLPVGTYTQAVIQKNEAGRIVLTWPSTPGRWYRIFYSTDLTSWTPSATPIQASANQVQWIDSGAPFTQTPPAGARYYMVTEIPAPAP